MPNEAIKRKLERTIGQITFRPQPLWLSIRPKAMHSLEPDYKEWSQDKKGNLAVYTLEERKAVEFSFNHLTFISESATSKAEMIKNLKKALDNVDNVDEAFTKFKRIGARQTYVYETNFAYQDLVELLYKKFYSNEARITEISNEKVRDTVYILDSEHNGFENHVHIGPVNQSQGLELFATKFSANSGELSLNREANIFIDVDVFDKEELPAENVIDRLSALHDECSSIINGYLDYILN